MSLGADFRDLMMQAANALEPGTINEQKVDNVARQLDQLGGLLEFGQYVDPVSGSIRKLNAGSLIMDGQGIRVEGEDTFAVFTGDQTYGGTTVSDGDAIFGNSSADKANLYWDKSLGQIRFRGGTSAKGWIDSSGTAVFGGGDVKLDDTGISIADGTSGTNWIRWIDSSGNLAGYVAASKGGVAPLEGNLTLTGGNTTDVESGYVSLNAYAKPDAGVGFHYTQLLLNAGSTDTAVFLLYNASTAGPANPLINIIKDLSSSYYSMIINSGQSDMDFEVW
ncbi:MAG: hypothetical protein KKD01_19815, partial [Proteobacteria bacterium]|nr:hypothetical protein [Pseudomonadota bacterium]